MREKFTGAELPNQTEAAILLGHELEMNGPDAVAAVSSEITAPGGGPLPEQEVASPEARHHERGGRDDGTIIWPRAQPPESGSYESEEGAPEAGSAGGGDDGGYDGGEPPHVGGDDYPEGDDARYPGETDEQWAHRVAGGWAAQGTLPASDRPVGEGTRAETYPVDEYHTGRYLEQPPVPTLAPAELTEPAPEPAARHASDVEAQPIAGHQPAHSGEATTLDIARRALLAASGLHPDQALEPYWAAQLEAQAQQMATIMDMQPPRETERRDLRGHVSQPAEEAPDATYPPVASVGEEITAELPIVEPPHYAAQQHPASYAEEQARAPYAEQQPATFFNEERAPASDQEAQPGYYYEEQQPYAEQAPGYAEPASGYTAEPTPEYPAEPVTEQPVEQAVNPADSGLSPEVQREIAHWEGSIQTYQQQLVVNTDPRTQASLEQGILLAQSEIARLREGRPASKPMDPADAGDFLQALLHRLQQGE
jgi:hypothetical protein